MTTHRDVGIALSGGGHRATVFGLGALMAVVDGGFNRQVTSISSVSGGSIANGVVMSGPDFGTIDPAGFEERIGPALHAIAHRGILLRKTPATAGYLRALIVAGVAAAIGVIGSLVLAIAHLWLGLIVSLVVAAIGLVAAWWLFRQRSERTSRAIDTELLDGEKRTLADVTRAESTVHHVVCTTELQTGDSFYFTNRIVYGYRFGSGSSNVAVPLSTIVQASACVPGAFAPRVIALSALGMHPPTYRSGEEHGGVTSIVVNDGGVYDNMADQWEYGYAGRLRSWPELGAVQPDRATFLMVVNGSGGWFDPKPIGRTGIAQEIAGLARSQGVQYDVSTAHRRQAHFDRFTEEQVEGGERTEGVFIQITDSPFRFPTLFTTDASRAAYPDAAARADAALDFLRAQGYTPEWWDDVVKDTSSVGTTLSRLDSEPTERLLEHGYVLTMVNAYVVGGRGALLPIDRDRFRRLCA